jgi:hypothetical protein
MYGDAQAEGPLFDDQEISQEDAWAVISAYFEEKGLVRGLTLCSSPLVALSSMPHAVQKQQLIKKSP